MNKTGWRSDKPSTLGTILVVHGLIFAAPALWLILYPFEGGDVYHNIWALSNNLRNLAALQPFSSANINYPVTEIGLLHELQPLNTLLFAPFYATGLYVTGYYVVLYLAVVLAAFCAGWLVLLLGGRIGNAILIGFATSVLGYRLSHLDHLQIVSVAWLLLPLVFWIRYDRDRRTADLLAYFAFLAPLLTGPSYIGIAGGLALCVLFSCRLLLRGWDGKFIVPLAAASVAAILVTLPINLQYLALMQSGLTRNLGVIGALSTDLVQLVTPAPGSLLGRYAHWTSANPSYFPPSHTFPGFLVLAAILVGLMRTFRRSQEALHYAIVALAVTVVMFVLISLGPAVKFMGQPIARNPLFYALYDIVPLLQATRFVAEFGFLGTILGLIVFGTTVPTIQAIDRSLRQRICGVPYAISLGAAVVVLAENIYPFQFRDLRLVSGRDADAIPAYRALATLPAGPVVSLPMGGRAGGWEYTYMYLSLFHGSPTVNGITGFVPLLQQKVTKAFESFPSLEALEYLGVLGIDYVVVHKKKPTSPVLSCSEIISPELPTIVFDDQFVCIVKHRKNPAVASTINSYRIGDTITFGDEGSFWRFIPQILRPIESAEIAGWSQGSAGMTWMVASKSSLALAMDWRGATDKTLRLEAAFETAFWPALGPEAMIEVWVNGTHVGNWQIDLNSIRDVHFMTLPQTLGLFAADVILLEFRSPAVHSAAELKLSGDPRRLSVMIRSLRISQSDPPRRN